MKIAVYDGEENAVYLTVKEMAQMAPLHFSLEQRVPGIEGKAFDLKQWYHAWKTDHALMPTHLTVEAADQFQATIPWDQLDKAALLYEQDELPLKKGFPIRLYVPDGSSNCLNVKSIVSFYFIFNGDSGEDALFGFKNKISLDEMRKDKTN